MIRKIAISILWFPASLVLLYINLLVLPTYLKPNSSLAFDNILSPLGDTTPYHLASSNTSKVLGTQIIAGDARIHLIEDFLIRHNSPLSPYAQNFVEEADKNGIDFRLAVSIAMCESNLGKRIPSQDSHNAWGIAVYTGQQHGKNFEDWPSAIAWVSTYLKERYLDRGHDTLREIGSIYAPPSVEKGHSWARCVEEFQSRIF